MIFNELPEFLGDVKKLSKNTEAYQKDIETIKKYLLSIPMSDHHLAIESTISD